MRSAALSAWPARYRPTRCERADAACRTRRDRSAHRPGSAPPARAQRPRPARRVRRRRQRGLPTRRRASAHSVGGHRHAAIAPRRDRGRLPPSGRRHTGHHRSPLVTGRRRSRPQTPRPNLQRRHRVMPGPPPGSRTPAHPPVPLPARSMTIEDTRIIRAHARWLAAAPGTEGMGCQPCLAAYQERRLINRTSVRMGRKVSPGGDRRRTESNVESIRKAMVSYFAKSC